MATYEIVCNGLDGKICEKAYEHLAEKGHTLIVLGTTDDGSLIEIPDAARCAFLKFVAECCPTARVRYKYSALEQKAIDYYSTHHIDCETDMGSPYYHARVNRKMSHAEAVFYAKGLRPYHEAMEREALERQCAQR